MAASNFQEHLAALSPYFQIYRQPSKPASGKISGAVYLFRHGNLEVSKHDYGSAIAPFLVKLCTLQGKGRRFVRGRLAPLQTYRSWITEAHVGMVSPSGVQASRELGRHFRVRYGQLLRETLPGPGTKSGANDGLAPLLTVWTDSAMRCRLSAIAFAGAFSGKIVRGPDMTKDGLPALDVQVRVVDSADSRGTCEGLSWHESLDVDQNAGGEEMRELMKTTAAEALDRLKDDWIGSSPFGVDDVYALQLLHCYDIVSGHESPFEGCFTPQDWDGFEYLRDTKYHFSEGYAGNTGRYAIPWMKAVMRKLRQKTCAGFPLSVAFTHREEVLYLCCLLGIGYRDGWTPDLSRVDSERQWKVSQLAPYLGHVGIESYDGTDGQDRLRVIVNGSVVPAFWKELRADDCGGYALEEVGDWVDKLECRWKGFQGL